jgi:hypothetical protein
MRRDAGRLGDHDDVHLPHAPARRLDVSGREDQHLDRVAPRVGRVGVGKQSADVAQSRRAEHGVRHGMSDRVAVRMAVQMHVGGDLDAAKHERAAGCEAVRVVPDAGAERRALSHDAAPSPRDHAAATAGAMIE